MARLSVIVIHSFVSLNPSERAHFELLLCFKFELFREDRKRSLRTQFFFYIFLMEHIFSMMMSPALSPALLEGSKNMKYPQPVTTAVIYNMSACQPIRNGETTVQKRKQHRRGRFSPQACRWCHISFLTKLMDLYQSIVSCSLTRSQLCQHACGESEVPFANCSMLSLFQCECLAKNVHRGQQHGG